MSFEGYVQALCKKGHLNTWDVYSPPVEEVCSRNNCDEPIVWSNVVDQTNGEDCGYVELEPDTYIIPCLVEDRDYEVEIEYTKSANPRRGYHDKVCTVHFFRKNQDLEQVKEVLDRIEEEKAKNNMWCGSFTMKDPQTFELNFGYDSGD